MCVIFWGSFSMIIQKLHLPFLCNTPKDEASDPFNFSSPWQDMSIVNIWWVCSSCGVCTVLILKVFFLFRIPTNFFESRSGTSDGQTCDIGASSTLWWPLPGLKCRQVGKWFCWQFTLQEKNWILYPFLRPNYIWKGKRVWPASTVDWVRPWWDKLSTGQSSLVSTIQGT